MMMFTITRGYLKPICLFFNYFSGVQKKFILTYMKSPGSDGFNDKVSR